MHPSSNLQASVRQRRRGNIIDSSLRACWAQVLAVAAFGAFSNLLQLTTSLYMMQVFDRVMAARSLDTLYYLSVVAILATGLMTVFDSVRAIVMQRIAAWTERRAATESFARAIEAVLSGGQYRTEALRDLATWRAWLASPSSLALFDLPWAPIYLGFVFLLHPVLGWIALAGAATLFVLTLVSEWATSSLIKQANDASMAASKRAESISRNSEVIDSMGMLPATIGLWRESVAQVVPPQEKANNRASVVMTVVKFVRIGVQIAALGVGAYLVVKGDLTSGAAMAGSTILGRALAPVEQIIGGWKQFVQAREALRRLRGFLQAPRLRPEAATPAEEPGGDLSIDAVSYAPPGREEVPVLRQVSLELPQGEVMAVIGPSAAGKTTLIRAIVGTVRPSSGEVRLGGTEVFTWDREDFGRYVGYLPQSVELFQGTVFENISRMAPEADTDAVYEAAILAGCHDMILHLPQGYETQIGEAGNHLSGGQRQMVGLARAMFGRPKLLVLDEPNSNLDGDAEATLMRTIDAVSDRGTTVVVVSHRPALVQCADRVLLLRAGAVAMYGARDEVLRQLPALNRATAAQPPVAQQIDAPDSLAAE